MSEYISKTELKQELKKHLPTFHHIADEVIDTMPPADVAPVVHAYWKRVQANHNTFRCSNCGHIRDLNHFNERIATPKLCEMCGAHMNGKPPESEDFYNATN